MTSNPEPLDPEKHFKHLIDCLRFESDAETKRLADRRHKKSAADAEKTGESLLDLVIADHRPGLGGRFLLTLIKRNRTLQLPWNRLRVGSPVVLSSLDTDDEEINLQGVVSRRSFGSIQVAVQEWPEGERFRIDLSADEITRKRQLIALRAANEVRGRAGELRAILMGQREPRFANELPKLTMFADLNESQVEAVRLAMAAEDLAIIHGPPGTGKTTTVVEVIRQAIARGEKVLACAPSNTAVDNLLERLATAGEDAVRLGHPARVDESLRDYTLDMLVENHENMRIVREMMREAEQLYRKASRFTRAKPAPGERNHMRREAKQLKDDARLLEKQAVDHVLDRCNVICATTTLDAEMLRDRRFDLVVIDESCQSTEPGCWIPILRAERIVLAGDHCQLPPTVMSTEATRAGFQLSLLERLVARYGDRVTRLLNVQYRMHHQIMDFSSEKFYDGKLKADSSVHQHVLSDFPPVDATPLTNSPVEFIDTAGADWDEELEPGGESRRNPSEGQLVLRKIKELQDAGLRDRDIAVIAPYSAQVRWLREHGESEKIEIDTVDGFQGREKEVILISLVRSNGKGEIGFLADTRRMNVALTRARRKLIVIGDSSTLGGNPFYASLLEYFESIGAYHTVWEEDIS